MTQIEFDISYIKEKYQAEFSNLKKVLEEKKFLIFFLTPKMGGKSTYIGLLKEMFPNKFQVISAGDTIREIQQMDPSSAMSLISPIFPNNPSKVLQEIKESGVKKLVSDEVLYKLILSGIQKLSLPTNSPNSPYSPNSSLILDGLPRTQGQLELSFNLMENLKSSGFTPLIINILVSDSILDKRMSSRRVCTKCGLVGNLDTLHTLNMSDVKYNSNTKEFFLTCPKCHINLTKKETDTSLEEMVERRAKEKEVYQNMVNLSKRHQVLQILYRTDIEKENFSGEDSDLNLSNSYYLDDNEVKSKTVRFESCENQKNLYSYHPRFVVGNLIKLLSQNLSPTVLV